MSTLPIDQNHGDLYSAKRIEQFATELASSHRVVAGPSHGRPMLRRQRDNRRALERSARRIGASVRSGHTISPAAEWLLDNFPLIVDQLEQIRRDLPPGFYLELPKLADGTHAGYPRVFGLVWCYVAHTESRADLDSLTRFVTAYQTVSPLTLGELWAVAISLRMVLIENLRRLSDGIVERIAQREQADDLADAELDPDRHAWVKWRLVLRGTQAPPHAFAARLVQRLHDRDPMTSPCLGWLVEQLKRHGTTPEEVLRTEHLEQVATHRPVRDGINSLRSLQSIDWGDFVEAVSVVEQTLSDPLTGSRHRGDFATRDTYRHAIEDLARHSHASELEVARRAVAKARVGTTVRERDPGYHLLAEGRAALEAELGYRPPLLARLRRALPAHPTAPYLGLLALGTGAALALPVVAAARAGAPPLELGALGALSLLPASEVAIAIAHRTITGLVAPKKLPKLSLDEGIPETLRTLVVIPALLLDPTEVTELVQQLELHYLANDDASLRFALLTDWADADTEHVDGDEALLAQVRAGVAALNRRYAPDGAAIFYVLHRPRLYNAREGRFMAWERKRGKLAELNRALRGATDTSFLPHGTDLAALAALDVRYVIALDGDTRLPRGAARKLVATLAHPLNRAVHDPETGVVTHGHGILQPRVSPLPPTIGDGTWMQRLYSGRWGLDPYAFATSDVYQDLFGEGCFVGKGIYDVDAFQRALEGRVPENALLSHDLFEGLYARSGLVTDIELFESPPETYALMARRQHRWTRGDWQLLPWIFAAGPLSVLSRWKMLDNLRRSLVPIASLVTLVVACLLPVEHGVVWVAFVLATVFVPTLLPVLLDAIPRRADVSKRLFVQALAEDIEYAVARSLVSLALLVADAAHLVDAITRTLARLLTGRGPMLEWTSAAAAMRGASVGSAYIAPVMAASLSVALGIMGLIGWYAPASLPLASPLLAMWGLSPVVIWAISSIPKPALPTLLDQDRTLHLRRVARRTWHYFEVTVTPEDNHLPPDNVQEDPIEVIGHRTSPTNIGLYLLASVAARDLGWISTEDFVTRVEATFATLDRLDRCRGHFYNWYDTLSLVPLHPRYVSTVDSGNLAGHLVVLQQACLEFAEAPHTVQRDLAGVRDTVGVALECLARLDRLGATVTGSHAGLTARRLAALVEVHPGTYEAWEELRKLSDELLDTTQALCAEYDGPAFAEVNVWAGIVRDTIAQHLKAHTTDGTDLAERLTRIAARAERYSAAMQWRFLFDKKKRLFATGYHDEDGRQDVYAYDQLASECRLASFLAIARGELQVAHWFQLGRRVTPVGRSTALQSWSGSMFEYLMPGLVVAEPPGSLLGTTQRNVVEQQIRYGHDRHVPWGISESAYNLRDVHLTYQYGNFGIPGLGVKVGLAEDLVVAPYATALAAMVDPMAAADNFAALEAAGAAGRFGFYESIDYTASRLPDGASAVLVKAFFAHHQGMSVVALCNAVLGFPMRRRFHTAPFVRATELLLHERTPRDVAVVRIMNEPPLQLHQEPAVPAVLREFDTPYDALPATHRLSNGRYAVAMTAAGSGQSQWGDLAITRWREDETLDNHGSYVFIRDVDTGAVWSAGHQPSGRQADEYHVSFHEHRVQITRRDGAIHTEMEVVVSPEDDGELRQLTLVNKGHRPRTLDLTSYLELVLAPLSADVSHRAFSNLFVETSFDDATEALLATRRPRASSDTRVWAAHVCTVHGQPSRAGQYETDRARFIGRGNDLRTAAAIQDGRPLSNTVGPVLDPIFSLRRRVQLARGQSVRVLFATLVGTDRARLLARCDLLHDADAFDRILAGAWTHSQVQLQQLGIEADTAQLYQRLGSRVRYPNPEMRAPRALVQRNRLGQSALWKFGISGDRPILLGRVEDGDETDLVRQLVHAHCYWRAKGLVVDLVLLDEQAHTYGNEGTAELERRVRASHVGGYQNGVHVVRSEHLSVADRELLLGAARVVVQTRDGSLIDQVASRLRYHEAKPPLRALLPLRSPAVRATTFGNLEFWNGVGGFAPNGRDYVIVLGTHQTTPLPWINVVANPEFGFVVSEMGSGFTWSENSRENQLTPASNDPVTDTPSEILYLRDDESGETWTPTPLPIREDSTYVVYHGQGFTSFVHESHGIAQELVQFVAVDRPIKFSRLRLRNLTRETRRLTVASYVEWQLGPPQELSSPFLVTSVDPVTGALLARNRWGGPFNERVAFLDLGGKQKAISGDRTQFIGRNGSRARPQALHPDTADLGRVGAGLDPCGALLTRVELPPGGTADVVVTLGQASTEEQARVLVQEARAQVPDDVLGEAVRSWNAILDVVQVKTPDRSMDLLMNRWLLYQTLSCRVWARAGFSQASGAYGFRDQLQDGMALAIARPDLVRAHLLRAAARQFPEGDVQHWWHPPTGKGVRTHVSDDRLWLAFAVDQYVRVTGDQAVLDESVPFLDAPPVGPTEDDAYQEPTTSLHASSLYEHVARALERSLEVGRHGLPLIGTGDWNDGMNRVGHHGQGESVWLAWFLIDNLQKWAPIARARGDRARAATWEAHAAALTTAVEEHGWDGDWYRRAYTDDGTPMGSAESWEGTIDSIPQSWAVLSGAAPADRAARAMAAVEERLVRRADALVLLLSPPFDDAPNDPGYIKGYPPGIRENGGQYTHAAIWVLMAFAALGNGNKAGELFTLLNPIHHGSSRARIQRYKGEPYAVAADVYAIGSHVGRAGWTWYTGSSAWMYRAGLESILGVRVRGDRLHLAPCIPEKWPGFEVSLRRGAARYDVVVTNPNGVQRGIVAVSFDGAPVEAALAEVPFVDDGETHKVLVTLG